MFGTMTRRTPFLYPELERLFEASFDKILRRAFGGDLKRDGMSASRFGRTVTGGPAFVGQRLDRAVNLDTADRVRFDIGEPPFRPLLRRELDALMALAKIKPWVIGFRSVRNASFVARLHRGASPYLSTVDRVRGWMHTQLHGGERRAIWAGLAEGLSFGMTPTAKRRFQP